MLKSTIVSSTTSSLSSDHDGRVGVVSEPIHTHDVNDDAHDLLTASEHYHLLAEHTRDLVALIDQESRYVYTSPSYLRVLGYEPATLHGTTLFSLVHPVDLAVISEQWPRLVTEGALEVTCRLCHVDGSWRWFEATFHTSVRQGTPHLVCVAQDITVSRQTERMLARLLRHNELILTSVGEGICGINLTGSITFANPAAAHMLGWEVGALIGQSLRVIVQRSPANNTAPDVHAIERTLDAGTTQRVSDDSFRRKDGSSFPVEYVCTPIREGGVLIGAVITFQDSTVRKRLETQLLQAQKMEGVGRLAGGIAHDFNNLLTGIIGYTGLAMRALPRESSTYHDMVEIEKAAQRAAGLIRQLLAFARKQIMAPRVLNLNDLILDLDRFLRRLIGEDFHLITRTATDVLQVKADPGQIEQVIVNLAVNARDAMPSGGKIIIETSHTVLTEADILEQFADLAAGSYVVLNVIDMGVGIPPEFTAQIFEPFFTTKELGKGTGLGLATCYGIIKQHGGTIHVSSTVGQGTTFRIYLPAVQPEPTAATALPADLADALPLGTETVLVVEDEPSVRALMAFVLREQGYTVLEATDGNDALSVMAAYMDDMLHLLLTDVVMPRMSGPALADQLIAQRPYLKVLFTSGYTDNPGVTAEHLRLGTAFLQKPFSASELARAVRRVLDS